MTVDASSKMPSLCLSQPVKMRKNPYFSIKKSAIAVKAMALICTIHIPVLSAQHAVIDTPQIVIERIPQKDDGVQREPIIIQRNPNAGGVSKATACPTVEDITGDRSVFRFRPYFPTNRKQDFVIQSYFKPPGLVSDQFESVLAMEYAAIADGLKLHGDTCEDYKRFIYTNRDRAIALVFLALLSAAEKSAPSADERVAVDWLLELIKAKRIKATQIALNEYLKWKADPCGYKAPQGLSYTRSNSVCDSRYGKLMSTPNPPSYDALQEYGAKQAHVTYDSNKHELLKILENETAGTLAKLGVIAASVNVTAVGVPAVFSALGGTVATGGGGWLFAGPIAGIVVGSVVIGVNEGMNAFAKAELHERLVKAHANATDNKLTAALLKTKDGVTEATSAFVDETRLGSGAQKAIDAWLAENTMHYLYRDASHEDFYNKWKTMNAQGYRLVDLETYVDDDGHRRWDGTFVPGSGKYYLWRNASYDNFAAKWRELSGQGYQLIDIETYLDGTTRRWAGVWGPRTSKGFLWRGASLSNFANKWRELSAQGYRLIDIETYLDGTTRKWAGVWAGGTGGYALWRNASSDSLQTKIRQWDKLKLVDVESYMDNGQRKWAGVWMASADGGQKHSLFNPSHQFANGWSKDAYQLTDYDSYDDKGVRRSIGVWTIPASDL